ncbi:MAG: DUF1028 domain-containing protein [Planctomycetes bacterium]|nr:DUF1028 domain-containing protein [Planctomycetota bacterium]
MKSLRLLGRLLLPVVAFALAAETAFATWSIVVVDTKTGEVGVACATCLPGTLEQWVPLIQPGYGAAAAQSALDSSAKNRKVIWNGFQAGLSPREILGLIQASDPSFQSRQFGIVDLVHTPETFTGSLDGAIAGGVRGQVGTLKYAIQGNVLTCSQVWLNAEQALLLTPGDLSQKMMAAMQAAKAQGGDGRCSCAPSNPSGCGCVTSGLKKSAHVGFIIVARPGDALGMCTGAAGCANGGYWLNLQIPGVVSDPIDPVTKLQAAYDAWRASMVGVPDQVASDLRQGAPTMMADGKSTTTVTIELRDLDGQSVGHGGHLIQIVPQGSGTPVATPQNLVDHGDGTYSFEFLAGTLVGGSAWRIVVTDQFTDIPLEPVLSLDTVPPSDLHCGYPWVTAAGGAPIPFTLDLGPSYAGSDYLLVGSMTGTSPGVPFAGLTLPLNFDPFMRRTIHAANQGAFHDTQGQLDADGRATAQWLALPGALAPFVGHHLDFAAAILAPTPPGPAVTSAVGFDVYP